VLPQLYRHRWMDEEIEAFREQVRRYITAELSPHLDSWRRQGFIPREVWRPYAELGFLLPEMDEAYGGAGASLAYQLVAQDELAKAEIPANTGVHNLAAHYILDYGTEAQKQRWLPKLASGEMLAGLALTEPGCGSDLKALRTRARRDGGEYVIDGAKTFITNGFTANLLVVAVRTGDAGSRGVSLVVLETENLPGFSVGRRLEKLGQHASDTAELFFDGVRVPAANLLGEKEGDGFIQLMSQLPYERLFLCVSAAAVIERAVEVTWSTRSSARLSDRRWPTSRTRASSSPSARRSRMWCAASSTTASSVCSTASWTRKPLTWPSGGAPSSSARSPTSACSSSAATATWSNTPSRACTPIRVSSAFTAALPRS
jgi:acyl-CoA dehydrogenase